MFGKSKEEKAEEKRLKKELEHKELMSNLFNPSMDGIRLALSGLILQDNDRKKLFETGDQTYLKIFGGDLNTFINTNAVILNASIQLKMLEQLEKINENLEHMNIN